ncbi:MAG: UPF0158 family protein [Flammeovirgaceae bacterium]|nr:UPF0158 family protein [Flammeovirgaceae bacterium]
MKLPNKIIKDIAEYLDCGMTCYLNKDTNEIKPIINSDDVFADEEPWKEGLEEIENKYIKIEKMSSHDAFQIMEDFTSQVSSKKIRDRLIYALNGRKPFRNFNHEIDFHGETRQHWFKYKAYRYQEWVKDYLEPISLNNKEENSEEENIPLKGIRFFDDNGNEFNPDLYPLPHLCLSCKKRDQPVEEVLCNLTRMDQLEELEFKCHAYEKDTDTN